jgi:hypothetical protein
MIHHVLSSMVLGLTAPGHTVYAAMFISAVVSPDSPFQAFLPVSLLLKIILETTPAPPFSDYEFSPDPPRLIPRVGVDWICLHLSKPTSTRIFGRYMGPGDFHRAYIVPSRSSDWAWIGLDARPTLKRLVDAFPPCFNINDGCAREGITSRATVGMISTRP